MQLGKNRLGHISFRVRRLIVGIALLPCILSVANIHFKWALFGGLDKVAVAVCFIALFLVMRYIGPTVQEVEDYRAGPQSRRT
jgi:hypothetical protein